jgi:hypothetical protein
MSTPPQLPPAGSAWSRYRREIGFLVLFVLILASTFTLISWNPVNDRVIEPFTGAIARAGGATLSLLGQQTTMNGTIIRNDRFAVNIRNGCNGVEAMLIYSPRCSPSRPAGGRASWASPWASSRSSW